MSPRYGPARLLVPVLWLFFVSASSFEDEQSIHEFYTQAANQQILSELELSGPPPQPWDAGEAVQLMLKEDEDGPWLRERLFRPKIRDGLACPATNDTTCFEFRFEFGPTLNGSALDLWVYWEGLAPLGTLSVTLSLTSGRTKSFHIFEVRSRKWNKLRLTPALALPDSWEKGAALVQIVVRDSERLVAQPYLMSSRRPPPSIPDRRRRDADDLQTSDACKLRPLNVSFSEMGFDFVLHPPVLQTNVCEGGCQTGQGDGRALSLLLQHSETLREKMSECWSRSCKPQRFSDLQVVFLNSDDVIQYAVLRGLIVESCACS